MTRTDSPNKTHPGRFSTITRHLRHYRGYLVVGGVAVILANGLMLVNPYITKLIFDHLENGRPLSEVGLLVLAMIGLAVVSGVFRFIMRRTIIWMSRHIEYNVRGELVAHLLKLSPSFFDNNRTGDIMARATNDLEAVRMMIGPAIMHLSNTLVVASGSITMMVMLSPRLTLYALVPAIVLPVVVHSLGNLIHRKFIRIQEHFSRLTATVHENLTGMRVVKAYRQERAEVGNFGSMSNDYMKLNLGMGRLMALFLPLIQLTAGGLLLVVLYFGGRDVIGGEFPLSTIVAFMLYLGMLTWPLMAIGWAISLYQRGTASLDRINSILFTEPGIRDGYGALIDKPIEGKIEFRDLSFGYGEYEVLSRVNLVVQPGETLGIVGRTGSGKSTLVSLVSRLYTVGRGQLFVDDVDVNDWQLEALRCQIGFATQEPFLFSASLADNIRFGVSDASTAQVSDVSAIAALAKDVREFPDRFETIVGERGIMLSGGQKQRAAIARAVLVDPAILILDDAVSSVDTETEYEISERLHARTRKLTTLIISHRVSSVKDADRIIYLEEGRIAEQGTHDELLAADGLYAELYRAQLLAQELEGM